MAELPQVPSTKYWCKSRDAGNSSYDVGGPSNYKLLQVAGAWCNRPSLEGYSTLVPPPWSLLGRML